jgi:hypothetical protein
VNTKLHKAHFIHIGFALQVCYPHKHTYYVTVTAIGTASLYKVGSSHLELIKFIVPDFHHHIVNTCTGDNKACHLRTVFVQLLLLLMLLHNLFGN